MATAQIAIPEKLIPVFDGPADVRGSYGGRGSAKTRSFAKMAVLRAYMLSQAGAEGIILCGRQFMNSLDDSSLEEVKGAIRAEEWLQPFFEVGDKYVRTIDGRIRFVFAGLDRNISSIKSKSRILLCWVDEAEEVTDSAWVTLIPTIREENSELWVTWNPRNKGSATNQRFRGTIDPLYKIVEMNWRDNPMFPAKLERERQRDLENNPEQYDHIWEGAYLSQVKGAYWAKELQKAKDQHRIGAVGEDTLMQHRLFVDIGGTGAKADAFTMWDVQFIGKEIRVLNYYESVGQPLGAHLLWMRERELTPDKAQIWLPHDGSTHDKVYDVSYESALNGAGYSTTVVPNQGKGAAKSRIEAVRRCFPNVWINKATCQGGIDALGFYHEKRDETRQIGLGPEHDWSSHGSDAFGLMAIVYEEYQKATITTEDPYKAFQGFSYG